MARDEIRIAEMSRGLRVKRTNALTTIITGSILALASIKVQSYTFNPLIFFWGSLAGLLYANGFEYVLHRFVLHWGNGFLVQRHALHHDSIGAADEARYVNFASSPWVIVLVFLLNAPAALAVEYILRAGLAAGMFAGFAVYLVAYEEIHWRIHFGGWLPRWLYFAKRHHMLHHGDFKGHYNVFLPIFDWLFERHLWKRTQAMFVTPKDR